MDELDLPLALCVAIWWHKAWSLCGILVPMLHSQSCFCLSASCFGLCSVGVERHMGIKKARKLAWQQAFWITPVIVSVHITWSLSGI